LGISKGFVGKEKKKIKVMVYPDQLEHKGVCQF